MTAKEKAKELVDKMKRGLCSDDIVNAKICALIVVDELIEQNGELYLNGIAESYYREKNAYLFEVKNEIEKL